MNETRANGILEEISKSISTLEGTDKVKEDVDKALKQGHSPAEIIEKGLRKGLDDVGKKYENGEYFLSELLYAGEIIRSLFDLLKPYLGQEKIETKGVILLGTVRGDVHDIGKNIFAMLAQFSGFKVHDLGVDVGPEAFIEGVRKVEPDIIGISTLLTSTLQEIKIILDRLRTAGIRDKVKVIIGGNAVTREFAEEIGADAAALDGVEGIGICKMWLDV